MANQYGNIGIVLQTRGDLDAAEEMYKKALDIANEAGFKYIAEVINKNLEFLREN